VDRTADQHIKTKSCPDFQANIGKTEFTAKHPLLLARRRLSRDPAQEGLKWPVTRLLLPAAAYFSESGSRLFTIK
jgi:hypothetical protein